MCSRPAIASSSHAQALQKLYSQGQTEIVTYEDQPVAKAIRQGIEEFFTLPLTTYCLHADGPNLWFLCILPWNTNPLILYEIGLASGECRLGEIWITDNPAKGRLSNDEVIQFQIPVDSPTIQRDCCNASLTMLQRRGVGQRALFDLRD